jgi:hypothetical protein
MSVPSATFHESSLHKPIRDLGLHIEGTKLEPVLKQFQEELQRLGIEKLHPRFYLSTEWGVPSDSVAIAIPFYLARPDLTDLHAERSGYVEGTTPADILRYLRHEMGHVVNYAYRLYEDEDWIKLFGSMTQPYLEEYRPIPFSRRYVVHLPGWYAQKHPDEDWAETFAVWMTPGRDWRAEYAERPSALAKLEYCDRTIERIKQQEPRVSNAELDEDVGQINYTIEHFYGQRPGGTEQLAATLDGALRAIFEDDGRPEDETTSSRRPGGALLRKLQRQLMADIYRWTGHFPEHTRQLVRHLAERADQLQQVYPENREQEMAVALTALITALAMNHVHRGSYIS